MTMHLELPPSDTDDAPIPNAQAAAAYEEMENEIKASIKNSSISNCAAPVPPAQVAALFEDMENGIMGSLKDDALPLHDSQIAKLYDAAEDEKKKGMKKVLAALPSTPEVPHGRPPIAPTVFSGSPSGQAASRDQMPSQRRAQRQRQAAAEIDRPPVYDSIDRPPRPSVNDETDRPSVPMFHEVEAILVPDEPVYDAVQIENEGSTPRPCWERYQKYVLGGAVGLIGGLALSMWLLFSANSQGNEEAVIFAVASTSPSKSSPPSQIPSIPPSFRPSLQPSDSFAPSRIPSLIPTDEPYFSSLTWKPTGQTLIGDSDNDYSGDDVAPSDDGNTLAIGSSQAKQTPVTSCTGNGGTCGCGKTTDGHIISMNRYWGDNNDEKVWGCGGAFHLTGASWNSQWGGTLSQASPEAKISHDFGLGFSQSASFDGWEGCCMICGANLQMAGKISDGWYCEKDFFSTGIWLKGKNK